MNDGWAIQVSDDLETRRRRAHYRAHHRGTKEMDWLVGRFADAHLEAMAGPALARFEKFLEVPDPELQSWILEPARAGESEFRPLIEDIRRFHGLAAADGGGG
ncbi:MAG: succinate dehydrogenase assembly factor 2 [Hyphomicrobiaceae bacterium]|nr:succinate dehydrogenase assembly factor 2 [Hyphomicrobiaceae bacterium]